MENLISVLNMINGWVWSWPLLLLIFGCGLYITWVLRGMQFRYLIYAFQQVLAERREGSQGDISPFQALMTTLAGAIGTGSIVGVATALTFGGMGALFWMWVTALIGMALKYAESILAVRYRVKDEKGEMIGGPMEYIQRGLGWNKMAIVFAIMGAVAAFGTGNLVQVNSIGEAVLSIWEINPWITGIILSVITGLVVLGGVKSIGNVAGVLVPVMALFYLAGGLLILILNYDKVPGAFLMIFESAFSGHAASGGFLGATVMMAIQTGVARSIFTNEAGMGISSIAAAAADTDSPARQALITMTGALLSTVIICTVTGLVIAVTGSFGFLGPDGKMLTGASMAIYAFSSSFTGGAYVVSIGLILFAFTTVIAWAYYGEKCCEYLFGARSVIVYRIIYTLAVIPGCVMHLEAVWRLADIMNGLMAIPNLIALLALTKVIKEETDIFLKLDNKERLMKLKAKK